MQLHTSSHTIAVFCRRMLPSFCSAETHNGMAAACLQQHPVLHLHGNLSAHVNPGYHHLTMIDNICQLQATTAAVKRRTLININKIADKHHNKKMNPFIPQLLLVLSAPTHGAWPGWVYLGGWLHTAIVYTSKKQKTIQILTAPGTSQLYW